ncbi:MAG: hypothetical protein ACM3PE_09715 [Deltaproteobacteria bacterium]
MATIKGVVLERKGNRVTVLTDSGEFKEFWHSGPADVGEMIVKRVYGDYGIYAAAVLMLFLITSQMVSFMTVSAYAQVEINPRIELGINRFDRVVSTAAINSDGEQVLNHISLKGMRAENAIRSIVAEARKEGFINNRNGQVTVTTIPIDAKGQKVADEISQTLEQDKQKILNDSGSAEAQMQVFQATKEQREKARRTKESLGAVLRKEMQLDVSSPESDNDDNRTNQNEINNANPTTEINDDVKDDDQVTDKHDHKNKHEDVNKTEHNRSKDKQKKEKINKADEQDSSIEVVKHDKPKDDASTPAEDTSAKKDENDKEKQDKGSKGTHGGQNTGIDSNNNQPEKEDKEGNQPVNDRREDNHNPAQNSAGPGAKR